MAAALTHLSGASDILQARRKPLVGTKADQRPFRIPSFASKKTEEPPGLQPQLEGSNATATFQASRRASVSLAVAALLNHLAIGASRAEAQGSGWGWLDGPLPVPTVTNKIANEATGTRSFLRNGIYMANIGTQGSAYRLKHYAFDLLALGDLMGKESWSYFRRYLCLKSTVMYYDFDKVISAASEDQKQPLSDLANRLFDNIEKLEDAVKKRSDPLTQSCYADTTVILQEVMARMA